MTIRTTSEVIEEGGAAPGRALRVFVLAAALGCAAAPVSGCLWWDGPSREDVREAAGAELEKQAAALSEVQSLFSVGETAYRADYRVDIESFEILFKEKDANERERYNFRARIAFLLSYGAESVRDEGEWRISLRKSYGEWETVAFEEEEEGAQ